MFFLWKRPCLQLLNLKQIDNGLLFKYITTTKRFSRGICAVHNVDALNESIEFVKNDTTAYTDQIQRCGHLYLCTACPILFPSPSSPSGVLLLRFKAACRNSMLHSHRYNNQFGAPSRFPCRFCIAWENLPKTVQKVVSGSLGSRKPILSGGNQLLNTNFCDEIASSLVLLSFLSL